MSDTSVDDLENEADDDTPLIRQLRQKLKDTAKEAKSGRDAATELATLRREDAIRKANVEGLNDRQMKTLVRELEGQDPTAENVRSIAVELGWATQNPEDVDRQDQIDAQLRISEAASGGGMPPNYSTITPDDVAEWPVDKILRFRSKYPDQFEALKRGEEVPGVVF